MIKLFFLILFLFYSSFAQTSKMSIEGKPQKSFDEIVGKRDSNGKFCAAIKVISDMDGFKYQSYNGVVEVDDQPGRDMVYLSPNERVLEIFNSGFEPLKIILSECGIQLREKDVWRIKIVGQSRTSNLLPVTIHTQPQDAVIAIDDKTYINSLAIKLSKGQHKVCISKQGYKTTEETINVSENNVYFSYSLIEMELQQVVIKSYPEQARIYLDNVEQGLTNDGFFLYPKKYFLKLIKDDYVEIKDTIFVKEGGINTFNYKLIKNTGTLKIQVSPANVNVLINKKDYTGQNIVELAPGTYRVEIFNSNYKSFYEVLTINRGQILNKLYSLIPKVGSLQCKIKPLETNVLLKRDGRPITNWNGMKLLRSLPVGEYIILASLKGYEPKEKKLTIEENRTYVYSQTLSKSRKTPVIKKRLDGIFNYGAIYLPWQISTEDTVFSKKKNNNFQVAVSVEWYLFSYPLLLETQVKEGANILIGTKFIGNISKSIEVSFIPRIGWALNLVDLKHKISGDDVRINLEGPILQPSLEIKFNIYKSFFIYGQGGWNQYLGKIKIIDGPTSSRPKLDFNNFIYQFGFSYGVTKSD